MSLIFASLAKYLHPAFFPAAKDTLKLLSSTSVAEAQLCTYYMFKKKVRKKDCALS